MSAVVDLLLLQYNYETKDAEVLRRNAFAFETWCAFLRADPRAALIETAGFKRDSSSIGCSRRVPFVKDLFDYGAEYAKKMNAALLYVNNDVAVIPTVGEYVREQLKKTPCCYGRRLDIEHYSKLLSFQYLNAGDSKQGGADLFCFTPAWWESVRDEVPDMLLGTEGWDFIIKSLMQRTGFKSIPCVIYHENHHSFWKKSQNLINDPGQRYNRNLGVQWARNNRYEHCIRDAANGFLFRNQPQSDTPVIVQLARYGDILSVIPVARSISQENQSAPIDWVVHKDFADVLRGCSYIRPHLFGGADPQNMVGGLAWATQQFPQRTLLATQVNQNPKPSRKMPNFILEQWVRAGKLDLFHTLPLVFDRREPEEESQVLLQHYPNDEKPVLLMNLSGHSSPYEQAAELKAWVSVTFAKKYAILDLGEIRLNRFLHFLPFLERASALLTIDTSFVHLATATETPTIVLSRDSTWYQSEPRNHWIAHLTYSQSHTTSGKETIEKALAEPRANLGKLVRDVRQLAG